MSYPVISRNAAGAVEHFKVEGCDDPLAALAHARQQLPDARVVLMLVRGGKHDQELPKEVA